MITERKNWCHMPSEEEDELEKQSTKFIGRRKKKGVWGIVDDDDDKGKAG